MAQAQHGMTITIDRSKSSGGRKQHDRHESMAAPQVVPREKPRHKPVLPVPPMDRSTKRTSTFKSLTVIKSPPSSSTYRSPGLNVSHPAASQDRPYSATNALWNFDLVDTDGGGDTWSRSKPEGQRPVSASARPIQKIHKNQSRDELTARTRTSNNSDQSKSEDTGNSGSDESSMSSKLEPFRLVYDASQIFQVFLAKNMSRIELEMFRDNPTIKSSKFYKRVANVDSSYQIWECDRTVIRDNLAEFVKLPVPIGCTLKCEIIRHRRGPNQGFYPVFAMFLEIDEECNHTHLMTARKRKKTTGARYIISTDPLDLTRERDAIVGKLRGNIIGSEFTMFDGGYNPSKGEIAHKSPREELGAIEYEKNFLGMKGPRKLKLFIPAMISETKRFERHPDGDHDTIWENRKKGLTHGIMELHNKPPYFNSKEQVYMLNFAGRVKETSIKNFQIVHEDLEKYMVLQSGRVAKEKFILDIQFPLCPLQAFGIALSSFACKIVSE